MIDLSALPSPTGLPAAADKPAAQAGEGPQGADFLALLTAQSFAPGPAQLPDAGAAGADAAPVDLAIAPAIAPASLPPTGKILPQLPVLPTVIADPATPETAQPPAAGVTLPLARVLLARFKQADPEAPAGEAEPKESETPEEAVAVQPHALSGALPLLALPAQPGPVEAAPTAADPVLASARPPAAVVQATPQGPAQPEPHRQAREQPQVPPAPAQPVLTVTAAAPPLTAKSLAATPLAQPQGGEARPAATLRVDVSDEPARPAVLPEPATEIAAPIALQASAAPAASAPVPAAQAAPIARPHEFGALVDRLVQAREALQPQAVTMAVQHAEFGPVQLHFRQHDNALSVSLASADPDFARAVSAAVPPVLAAPTADSASFASGQRQDQSAQTASDSGSQPRGQSPEAHDQRGQPRANPGRTNLARSDDTASTRQGIFA